MSELVIVDGVRVRHYHGDRRPDSHCSYRGVLHGVVDDKPVSVRDALDKVLSRLPEGTLVKVTVTTAPRDVAPDDYWCLLRPHEYGHVRELESEQ